MSDIDQSRKDAVAAVNGAVRSNVSYTSAGPAIKAAEAATAQAAAIVYLADVLREAFKPA